MRNAAKLFEWLNNHGLSPRFDWPGFRQNRRQVIDRARAHPGKAKPRARARFEQPYWRRLDTR